MTAILDRVLPYVKAQIPDDDAGDVLELSAEDSPVLEPFVGTLLVTYVVDEGASLRLITQGELRRSGLSQAELRVAALANLTAKIAPTGVRLVPYEGIVAVLFDGNFEATLLLWDELWPHVQQQLGPDLFAVAPARDILAVGGPDSFAELQKVGDRIWPNGDHLLTREVYRRVNGAWTLEVAPKR